MKSIINFLVRLFVKPELKEYVEILRNEPCFCGNGKKYKKCHFSSLDKNGKIALYEIDIKTKKKKLKIYSKRKFKGISMKQPTSLRGADVKATNIALNDHNPEIHNIYKF